MTKASTPFTFETKQAVKTIPVSTVYCIGYTGRNQEKVEAHVEELAELGVPRPDSIPAFYPMRLSSLSTKDAIQVSGNETSGEAEIVLIFADAEVYVTVGSDHTDRELETVDIGKSKQVCDKPIAKEAWKVEEVLPHWDKLTLSTDILIEGKWKPYQHDKFSAILSFDNIAELLKHRSFPTENAVFFAGTVPLLHGFQFGEAYKMALEDPVLQRKIELTYEVTNLTASKREVNNS
ncbi:DUF2848 family protein [Alteribacillus sp. HJP-4]|uniref:DUF2848 family protein n=1 Tax=Alteribacillus sp. HJP-4 TaxID=2775394 RepID=UPI0035CCD57B